MSHRTEGRIFRPSVGGRGSLRGDRAWGRGRVAGGQEQGSWGLERVSKGLGGWGLERAEGLGSVGGWGARPLGDGTDVRLLGRTEIPPSAL